MRRVGTLGLVAALAAILVSPLPAHAEDASGAVTYNAEMGIPLRSSRILR